MKKSRIKSEKPPYSKYKENAWIDEFADYYQQYGPPKNSMRTIQYGDKKSNQLYRCDSCKQVWQGIWNRNIEYMPHFQNLPATLKTCMYCEKKGEENGI